MNGPKPDTSLLNRFERHQRGGLALIFPTKTDRTCACGCGLVLPKGRRRWASDDCLHACEAVAAVYLGRNPRPAVFERDGGRCRRCRFEADRWEEVLRHATRGVEEWGGWSPEEIAEGIAAFGLWGYNHQRPQDGPWIAPRWKGRAGYVEWTPAAVEGVRARYARLMRLFDALHARGFRRGDLRAWHPATSGYGTPSESLWQADHITPVEAGGGGCGLEGYQTLCLACHRIKSREDKRRYGFDRPERARVRREAQAAANLAHWNDRLRRLGVDPEEWHESPLTILRDGRPPLGNMPGAD